MILSSDLHKAVTNRWIASHLDDVFNGFWSESNVDQFPVLHDQEAGPGQPFPYCVFQQEQGTTISKMSRTAAGRYEIREVPWDFRVHARAFSGDERSAKEIASALVEEICKVFGGHPTSSPGDFSLDNGSIIQSTYLSDYGVRTGDDEYQWIIKYSFLIDAPVAA